MSKPQQNSGLVVDYNIMNIVIIYLRNDPGTQNQPFLAQQLTYVTVTEHVRSVDACLAFE